MSSPVFVCDAHGRPLMPMAPAYARKLLQSGRARRLPHHAFTIIQLMQPIEKPKLRSILLGISIHLNTAELILIAEGAQTPLPLLSVLVDLHTDLPRRLRRRAGHRRRRRARGRYRAPQRYGVPFKLRRPSLARSSWGVQLRRQAQQRRRPQVRARIPSPTIQWRVQAIMRVISRLRALLPISHVLFARAHFRGTTDTSLSSTEQRERLLEEARADGGAARCFYCGRSDVALEVEHQVPEGRGGSDAQANLVLSCGICNKKKRDRRPEEAGLVAGKSYRPNRADPYRRQTAQLLAARLRETGWTVKHLHSWQEQPSNISATLVDTFKELTLERESDIPLFVAKPIARPRKQVFSARNYPLSTPLKPSFVVVGTAVKRRIRVNHGLALRQHNGKMQIKVVGVDQEIPTETERFIKIGMLCEGARAGQVVLGIVGAIHSTGRLTLLCPEKAAPTGIAWERIVVSPRLRLKIRSTDAVIFLRVSAPSGEQLHESGSGD